MDFTPTDDQAELRSSVRAFLERECPPAAVRRVFEGKEPPVSGRSLWGRMTELGWPALTVPERAGGLGLGAVELVIVAEEMGRAAAPVPFLATVSQFAALCRQAPGGVADDLLRAVAAGEVTGTLAVAEDGGRWEPEAVAATARRTGTGWVLNGVKSFVCDGATADRLAVVARAEATTGSEGLGVFLLTGRAVSPEPLPVLDPTQPLARIVLDGVPAESVLVDPGDPAAWSAVTRAIEEATAATAAATVGACRWIFDTTLAYAKQREQYGRPIGSFQALKHRLVDMYLYLERAAALVAYAALTIAEDDPRRAVAVAMAKAAAGDCQRLLVEDGLQLHGGIGFTWENDLQMWLKRAKAGDFVFGTAATHRARVARLLGVAA